MERADPGAGEPSGIRSLASAREATAERLQHVRSEVVAADSAVTTSEWTGHARVAFGSAVAQTLPDLELLISGLRAQSSALQYYAGQVQLIKAEQAALEERRRASRTALGRFQSGLVFASHEPFAPTVDADQARRARARLEETVAHEAAALASVDA